MCKVRQFGLGIILAVVTVAGAKLCSSLGGSEMLSALLDISAMLVFCAHCGYEEWHGILVSGLVLSQKTHMHAFQFDVD